MVSDEIYDLNVMKYMICYNMNIDSLDLWFSC